MCIKLDCAMKSHQQTKATGLFDEPEMVFIMGPNSKGSAPTTVFSSPAIPRSVFESDSWVTHWSTAQKTLKAWQVSFAALSSGGSPLGAEASMAICVRTEKHITFAVTPRKRERSPLGSVADSPGSFVAIESPLVPMLEDLGPTEGLIIAALGPAWKILAENMKAVEKIARAAHARAKRCESATNEDLEQVDYKLAALHSLLGERPARFGTEQAFDVLSRIMEELEGLSKLLDATVTQAVSEIQAGVAEAISTRLSQAVEAQIKAQVFGGRFYQEFVVPTTKFLKRCSPNAKEVGALWENRLATLEADLGSLKRTVAQSVAPPAVDDHMMEDEGMAWWGEEKQSFPKQMKQAPGRDQPQDPNLAVQLASVRHTLTLLQRKVDLQHAPAPTFGVSARGNTSDELAASPGGSASRLIALERAVKELKSQSQRAGVTIGGVTFESPNDAKAWMTKYGVEKLAHLFVDPLSLLALSDSISAVSEDVASAARFQSHKIRETVEMTKYKASFMVEIPPILGKRVNPSTIPATDKQLAGIPKHTDWNTGTGSDGVADRMAKLLQLGEQSLSYEIEKNLEDKPHALATKMLAASASYWDKLSSWMTLYHSEIGVRSHATKEECWLLVTSCVRTILSEAHMARLPGRNGDPHDMLWGTLQAHSFFASLTSAKIQGHPKISVILQSHVVDHSTPIALYRSLATQVEALTKLVGAQKGAMDRAVSKQGNKGSPAGAS